MGHKLFADGRFGTGGLLPASAQCGLQLV